MKALTAIGCGLALGVGTASCARVSTFAWEDHCANQNGDDWCGQKYVDGSRPYCSRGIPSCEAEIENNASDRDGCVAARPVDDVCYSPCGGGMSLADDAMCLDGDSSSSGTGSSSGSATEEPSESGTESSTTGPIPCMGNEDCSDAAAPFCEPVGGECLSCDGTDDPDGACAGLDPGAPLCVGGACVQCTPENPVVCDDQLLLCDEGTNACVSCTEHDQCGSGACELAVGRCFPEDFVVHVDFDGGQDYASVVLAVNVIDDGTHGVIVVHDRDDGLGYQGTAIDGGKTVALLAAPGEAPIIQGTGGNPGVRATGAGTIVYMDGLSVSGNAGGLGVLVDGAFAWADRSRIVQNTGGGVLAQTGAELTLRNCFSGGGTEAIGLEVVDASATVVYSTITASTFGATPALGCTTPVAVDLRNSIVVSQGGTSPDELSCASATVVNSATEADVGGFNLGWFTDFNTGDFSLSASGATTFGDIAQWTTGDPLTDIDGDPRPVADGTPDYAGADVP